MGLVDKLCGISFTAEARHGLAVGLGRRDCFHLVYSRLSCPLIVTTDCPPLDRHVESVHSHCTPTVYHLCFLPRLLYHLRFPSMPENKPRYHCQITLWSILSHCFVTRIFCLTISTIKLLDGLDCLRLLQCRFGPVRLSRFEI